MRGLLRINDDEYREFNISFQRRTQTMRLYDAIKPILETLQVSSWINQRKMRISRRDKMDDCGDYSISRRCRALVGRRCDETSNYLDMFPHENRRYGRCLDFFRVHSANYAVTIRQWRKPWLPQSSRDKTFSNRESVRFLRCPPSSSVIFAEFTSSMKYCKLLYQYSHLLGNFSFIYDRRL